MGIEINLLATHPAANRDYDKRAQEKTPEIISIAKEFGRDFFDGDRKCGYGGYKYDGRWKAVAQRMKDYYLKNLTNYIRFQYLNNKKQIHPSTHYFHD